MSYKNPECDVITKYRILTKMGGICRKDVKTMTGCSDFAAQEILHEIRLTMASKRMDVKGRTVPAEEFIRYMRWDFEKIQRLAFAEMAARGEWEKQRVGAR